MTNSARLRTTILVLFLPLAALAMQSCSSTPSISKNNRIDSTASPATTKDADPFTVLDDKGRVDSALVESKLEAARQEWLRALAAEQRKDKNEAVKRFESSIDILNHLIYYPGVSENRDFQELTRSVFEDYEKYVAKIDVLPPSSSIFAFRQKFNQEMAKMDYKNIPIPNPSDIAHTQVPLVVNPAVEQSIAYFMSGGGRTFMQRWLGRSGKFFPMMKQIFREVGTPEELIYLSMIESGLNPTVTSRAQAVGLWQFIDGTGALYGLRSNWWFDNKRDPVKETYAAARHLKDLYRAMGDWYLALSCYNCSMTRIKRCMAESQDTTFWGIRDCLPRETQNYVPLYIAATLIAMDPARYGFTGIQYEQPMTFDTVRVHESVDMNALGMAAGVTGFEIKDLNPELLQFSTPPPEMCDASGYCLRVPAGTAQNFYKGFALLTNEQKRPWMIHTVERGETLHSIAHTYGLSSEQLASYNNLDASERVRRGTRLRVPMSVMSPGAVASGDSSQVDSTKTNTVSKGLTAPSVTEVKAPAPPASEAKKIFHRVRKGENLNSIASRYGVRVSDIRNWNNISYHHKLLKGQRLAIYVERSAPARSEKNVAEKSSRSKKHWTNYTVKRGDTMAKIADDFGVSLASLKKWNAKSVRHGVKSGQHLKIYTSEEYADAPPDEAPAVAAKSRTHTVRPGETMTSIASMFGTSVEKLIEWNDNKEPSSLQAGEKLKVYAPNKTASKGDSDQPHKAKKVTYRVRRGDTLYSIAEKYGVSVDDLKSANNLTRNKIPAGKKLAIPAE
ncbi:MAG TPA: LysM peptidoglycan-binding domain-containing protein [Candidatus Kapabacteria bacterium]|nr:LysM peptidoglycan-binding domain-containing protein [Candidatus Kapabacteria bacterium]